MLRLTPVLVVPHIEPVLPLWEALGFARTAEVPHGERLGFVILERGAVQVMYQSEASVQEDIPAAYTGPAAMGAAMIFVQVEDLAATRAAFPLNTEVLVEQRTTFYGSTETIVRDAAGNVVTFAQFAPKV